MTPRIGLLDVNVLVALAWPNHVHHQRARAFFAAEHVRGWATTPVTESGFVRVSSNRAALVTAGTPATALLAITAMTKLDGHVFWPDDVPLLTGGRGDPSLVTAHRHVTDAHLLALAERHGGQLVTLDAGVDRLLGNRSPDLLRLLS